MSFLKTRGVKISGIAASVPKLEVLNIDYPYLEEKEKKLLIKTTGIEKRRIAKSGQTASDLCIASAEGLLNNLDWDKEDIGLLIFVTQTPDYITPATAAIMQDRLGLSKECIAFDINLGCSGYVYGLSVAAALLQNSSKPKALLMVGDVSSATISERDKSAAPIFSDAGSVTALEQSEGEWPMVFNLQTDGAGYDKIIIPEGGFRTPLTPESLILKEVDSGIHRTGRDLILRGIDIFNFSIKEAPANIENLLKYTGRERNGIDYFIFHQANKIINDTIKRKLKLEDAQVPYSIKEFGNTSSATIPLTIVTQLNEQIARGKYDMILCGFGVGLSWGSVLLSLGPITCPRIIEVD